MTHWDYKMVQGDDADPREEQERLQHWGKQGWELVAVLPRRSAPPMLYFKRPMLECGPDIAIRADGTTYMKDSISGR